jgi:hypothetical protein
LLQPPSASSLTERFVEKVLKKQHLEFTWSSLQQSQQNRKLQHNKQNT